jgi:hypothetical protein
MPCQGHAGSTAPGNLTVFAEVPNPEKDAEGFLGDGLLHRECGFALD